MFKLFAPKCPLGTREKTWVEWRMRWLVERFGFGRMRNAPMILPDREYFPDRLAGNRQGAEECFVLMCRHMGIDPDSVSLEIVDDEEMPGAAGLYEKGDRSNICVAKSQIDAPAELLATIAHELAHELLLKGGHLTEQVGDHEQVTDLLPVILGTGVFIANAPSSYLSSIRLGYALAVFAYVRGERSPPWAEHLRTDAEVTLRAGLTYLRNSGDSLLRPDNASVLWTLPTVEDILDSLRHR
jgi:hypothetical protein